MHKRFVKDYEHMIGLMGELSYGIPETMDLYADMHQKTMGHMDHLSNNSSALTPRLKELIALGIAVAIRCEHSVGFHAHDALRAGASIQEALEAIGVAITMGGTPSVMAGSLAIEQLKEFDEENRRLARLKAEMEAQARQAEAAAKAPARPAARTATA